jgi:hypothetical protein
MKIEPQNNCPLNGFKPCLQLGCAWFMQIRGQNPNTGEEVDDWRCAMLWMPMLTIESSLVQRHTGAAIESFRNEMVNSNDVSQQILLNAVSTEKLVTINNI